MNLSRLAPALFVVLWATGFIGARYAMPWSEPFSFLAVRFAIAFLLLAGLLAFVRAKPTRPRDRLHAAFAGMLMHGVYLGGVFWAIRHGMPAGLSALIVALQPLITAVVAGFSLGERILPRHWLGLAIGFVGVVIVLLPKLGTVTSGVTAATLAASVISVVGMSAGTIWQKRFITGVDLVPVTLYQYLGATLLMVVGSFALETRTFVPTGELLLALAWSVLVLSLGAIFLLMYLIRHGEMSKVSSLFYLVPAVTALMAWALFSEELTALQIAGMAIATLGVALATVQLPMRARASR
ncbi:DMT family transporter [Aquibium oceanicum]|uniref:EamA family transporter n=1 Tax=Aquibium oceanicum TaxID=1670800 RepID=A0A1L3SX24_9HYPH|nr:DMT family transporter [Aquibium oceanicum]APH73930.1 EamA family transporter [Aquibium oceanicum]